MENRILGIVFHNLASEKLRNSQGGDSLTMPLILGFNNFNCHEYRIMEQGGLTQNFIFVNVNIKNCKFLLQMMVLQ